MSNFNYNRVILGGRLASVPELKSTPGGVSLVTFSLAVKRRGQKEGDAQADFISVTAFRGTAEFISRYFEKGSSICIDGRIQTRSWLDDKGAKRYATEVIAGEAYFVDAKREGSVGAPPYETVPVPSSEPDVSKGDEDLPL